MRRHGAVACREQALAYAYGYQQVRPCVHLIYGQHVPHPARAVPVLLILVLSAVFWLIVFDFQSNFI